MDDFLLSPTPASDTYSFPEQTWQQQLEAIFPSPSVELCSSRPSSCESALRDIVSPASVIPPPISTPQSTFSMLDWDAFAVQLMKDSKPTDMQRHIKTDGGGSRYLHNGETQTAGPVQNQLQSYFQGHTISAKKRQRDVEADILVEDRPPPRKRKAVAVTPPKAIDVPFVLLPKAKKQRMLDELSRERWVRDLFAGSWLLTSSQNQESYSNHP